MSNNKRHEYIGISAAKLSLIEIGLGGLLHALHMPLSGHFLSLNQIFFLARTQNDYQGADKKTLPSKISLVVSGLKSLSPIGKKLGPMLAISAQGLLFNLGQIFFGVNIIGQMIGALLSSLWAFIQPACFYLILYQKDLAALAEYYLKMLSEFIHLPTDILKQKLLFILLSLVVLKLGFALAIVVIANSKKMNSLKTFQDKLLREQKYQTKIAPSNTSPWIAALKDLCSPFFLLSVLMTLIFFIFADHGYSKAIWIVLRPIILGYFLFLVMRMAPLANWAQHIIAQDHKSEIKKSMAMALLFLGKIE